MDLNLYCISFKLMCDLNLIPWCIYHVSCVMLIQNQILISNTTIPCSLRLKQLINMLVFLHVAQNKSTNSRFTANLAKISCLKPLFDDFWQFLKRGTT